MRHILIGLAVAFAVLVSSSSGLAQRPTAAFDVIVVFKDDAPIDQFRNARADERAAADPDGWDYLDRRVVGATQALEARHQFRANHVYSEALRGFSARLTIRQLSALDQDPMVDYIEPDGEMFAIAQSTPWGITKIGANTSSTLAGNGSGAITGVNVYIIDTGIDTKHADLNVVRHVNFAGGPNRDCHGHGTHVAGTAAARDNTIDVVGVAPGAPLTAVKVLNCAGSGSTSGVIKGVDYVRSNAVGPSVANLSLGGGANTALDTAVKSLATAGVMVAVAAGNSGALACNSSPARAGTHSGVVTVAATDSNDNETSWSNYGTCVDIWAPGSNIPSTRNGGGTTTMSGTSMASPHVAGAGALFLSGGAAPAASVETAIKNTAVAVGKTSKDGRPIMRLFVGTF